MKCIFYKCFIPLSVCFYCTSCIERQKLRWNYTCNCNKITHSLFCMRTKFSGSCPHDLKGRAVLVCQKAGGVPSCRILTWKWLNKSSQIYVFIFQRDFTRSDIWKNVMRCLMSVLGNWITSGRLWPSSSQDWRPCHCFLTAWSLLNNKLCTNTARIESNLQLGTGLSKKMDGIWNRYNLKSTGRIYTFSVLKCSEKFKVLDLP